MYRLRRKAEMSHDGDARREDALDRLHDLRAALQLDGIGLGLLHDADGRVECDLRVALIGAEGQVDDHQCAVYGTHDRARMIDHHIQSYGECGLVTGHYVGSRVADQNHVYACGIDDLGHRIVVRG